MAAKDFSSTSSSSKTSDKFSRCHCNLWHKDLQAFFLESTPGGGAPPAEQQTTTTTTTASSSCFHDDEDKNNPRGPKLNLVDVDCNLWHKDLQAFFLESTPGGGAPPAEQQTTTTTTTASSSCFHDDEDVKQSLPSLMANPWKLLQYDDTYQIAAMLTPCSTLTESRVAAATLQHYYYHDCDHEQSIKSNNNDEHQDESSNTNHNHIVLRTTLGVHPYHVTDDDVTKLAGTTTNDLTPSMQQANIEACMQELRDLYHRQQEQQRQQEEEEARLRNGETKYPRWIVAVGECGLDRAPGFPPLEEHQLPWFQAQIALAQELQLPLFVHERWAFDETIQALEHLSIDQESAATTTSTTTTKATTIPVLIHCFTGNAHQLETYLNKGYYISLAGGFLAKAAAAAAADDTIDHTTQNAKSVAQALPRLWSSRSSSPNLRDRLMLETDAPYMGFPNCRSWYLEKHQEAIQTLLTAKKRKRLQSSTYPNVPSSLEHVLDMVHSLLVNHYHPEDKSSGCGSSNNTFSPLVLLSSRQELAEITTANAQRFFGIFLNE
ncbi:hypothetical protein ACA910_010526 [Epithemia clementina (nom. ined.)]